MSRPPIIPQRKKPTVRQQPHSTTTALSANDTLQKALRLHQAGRLKEAKAAYQHVLVIQPDHAIAAHNFGAVLAQEGDFSGAISWMEKAIALKPDYVDAYSNLGSFFVEQKQFEAGLKQLDKAISIKPGDATLLLKRAKVFRDLNRFDEALADYDEAVTARPSDSFIHYERGVCLRKMNRGKEALTSIEKSLTLEPNYVGALSTKGNILRVLKRYEESLACHDKATALKPEFALAHLNRGVTLLDMNRLDEALVSLDKAILLEQGYGLAHSNRGTVLTALGRLEDAISSYEHAIAIDPKHAEAHWNRSLCFLTKGDFENGWQLYEWRWENPNFSGGAKRKTTKPLWLGKESLASKTILLHAEQGLGDTLQFCRYASLVKQLGATVLMEVQKPLHGLLKQLEGIDSIIAKGEPAPPFDFHCPLLSLPLAFGTKLTNIPGPNAYIKSEASKRKHWTTVLGEKRGMRVGLVWSGNANHKNDHNRSLKLETLLACLPDGFEYVCLQKEIRDADRPLLENSAVKRVGDDLKDFSDTAALCDVMDLVISIDTSVAHLAAALGKPTWIMLPFVPDFRWLLDREDSPWYPSARLFRQQKDKSWDLVLSRVAAELKQLFEVHQPAAENTRSQNTPQAKPPTGWNAKAHQLWLTEKKQDAINVVCAALNGVDEDSIDLVLQLAYYVFLCGDPASAANFLERARQSHPKHPELLKNLAVCLGRSRQASNAVLRWQDYIDVVPNDYLAFDGLASSHASLKNYEQAAVAGTRALRLKDASIKNQNPRWRLPGATPKEWLKKSALQNVVSFSLWGENPRYLRGALDNLLAKHLYDGWTFRIYLDDSVPETFVQTIAGLGAQVIKKPSGVDIRSKLCWRFEVANDVTVGRFLIRDIDSVISQRECHAVAQWIESDQWFHVMRDWWTHTDLMLAGMWGGVANVLPNIAHLLQNYKPSVMETPNIDQWFLRDCIWAYVRQSCMVHDRCFQTGKSVSWPDDADSSSTFHVGQDVFSAERSGQENRLAQWIEQLDCLKLA